MSLESATADPPHRATGALVSLTFWLSLLVAGGLFAAATLSGKVLETERRAVELAAESTRVEHLALEIRRLELEARALETDPDYIAAVARRKLAAQPAAISAPARSPVEILAPPLDPRLDPLRPWMLRIATDSLLRARLLTAAAALILFAFTFLHERPRPAAT